MIFPEEHLVAEMVQYGKERLRSSWLCAILFISPTIYERAVREYWLYLAWQSVYDIIFQIMEERQSILSMGPGSSSKWMRAPEYRQQTAYAKRRRCLSRNDRCTFRETT